MRRIFLIGIAISLLTLQASQAYVYNASDFATQVTEYVQGTGLTVDYVDGLPFNNSSTALGRPTVDTTGDDWYFPASDIAPVVSIYASFRSFEIVTVGKGGRLTLKFNHQVTNDSANPYGIDFIVYGNAQQNFDSAQPWENGDPSLHTVYGTVRSEAQKVSVSQDGVTWYTYTTGPYTDSFAPTLGRVYDPANPDTSIGSWNQWWGQATDPTLPLPTALTAADFAGYTVAQMAEFYGQSAGGTGFDLAPTGWDWIQYVRIENPSGSTNTPEVDAIADVAPRFTGDVNLDGRVNFSDYLVLSNHFGGRGAWNWGDFTGDTNVDFSDYLALSQNFGSGGGSPIPEPITLILMASSVVLGAMRKR